jgi:hypothetical protein
LIRDCTGIAVITFEAVGKVFAPTALGTDIIGAFILVVADYRRPTANSVLAMIGSCTEVTIHALCPALWFMLAPGLAGARVFGALVAVIAQADKFTLHFCRFVSQSITIIIKGVTCFLLGLTGITIGQPVVAADSLAFAATKLISFYARGP